MTSLAEDGINTIGTVPTADIDELCASGDGVCEKHGFDITAAHLSYGTDGDAATAAAFIIKTTGVSA